MTGVAIAGSIAGGHPDIYSDVDLIMAIDDEAFDWVMKERLTLIGSWASLVAGFTGEHVGEPRLINTLVRPPLLHVDFKFVRASDCAERVEDRTFCGTETAAWPTRSRSIRRQPRRPTSSGSRTASGSGALRCDETRPR